MDTNDVMKSYVDHISSEQSAMEKRFDQSIDRLRSSVQEQVAQMADVVNTQGEQLQKANNEQNKRFARTLEKWDDQFASVQEELKKTRTASTLNTFVMAAGLVALIVAVVLSLVIK